MLNIEWETSKLAKYTKTNSKIRRGERQTNKVDITFVKGDVNVGYSCPNIWCFHFNLK